MLISPTENAQFFKRLPSWIYKLGVQSFIDRNYPRHLFIETTADCNLHCTYCPREQIENHMDFRLFKEIVDEASRYGRRSFSLHLFGEPLLYPKLFDAVEYILQRNTKHTILLTTNGTLLNRYCDELVHSGVSKVFWTWRKEAKFRPETKAKLRRWGRFFVRFIDEVTTKEGRLEWKNWPFVEERRLHNYGGTINPMKFQSLKSPIKTSMELQKNSKSIERWPCYHLWLAPAVAWNGKILLCCADPHQKEPLGEFPLQTVAEVWKGKKLNSVRESHLKGSYSGICKDCDVWKSYPDLFFNFQKNHS